MFCKFFWKLIFFALLPAGARGHGFDSMVARVSFEKNSRVRVEITADYENNPMFDGEGDARESLRHVLRLREGERSRELGQLAPPRWEHRRQLGANPPELQSPDVAQKPHRLLTAIYEWQPAGDTIALEIPKRNPHNVMLWIDDPKNKSAPLRWIYLIAGDCSPPIAIPQSNLSSMEPFACYALAILVAAAVLLLWEKIQK